MADEMHTMVAEMHRWDPKEGAYQVSRVDLQNTLKTPDGLDFAGITVQLMENRAIVLSRVRVEDEAAHVKKRVRFHGREEEVSIIGVDELRTTKEQRRRDAEIIEELRASGESEAGIRAFTRATEEMYAKEAGKVEEFTIAINDGIPLVRLELVAPGEHPDKLVIKVSTPSLGEGNSRLN